MNFTFQESFKPKIIDQHLLNLRIYVSNSPSVEITNEP